MALDPHHDLLLIYLPFNYFRVLLQIRMNSDSLYPIVLCLGANIAWLDPNRVVHFNGKLIQFQDEPNLSVKLRNVPDPKEILCNAQTQVKELCYFSSSALMVE